ncbi:hypothetical protein M9Y10_042501 [Tritrichomonas musculus]|uniref:Uncharacterized protein n=1 Tax=Tritrichomonas musculus TaxID=1915356 RepID=A0ABR2GNX5_9EUKA
MKNGENRKNVQNNLYEIASYQLEQNNDTTMLLSSLAGAFLDFFIVNLKEELKDREKIELQNQGIQYPDELVQNTNSNFNSRGIFDKEFFRVKAVPNYRMINTNNICFTLKRMNFENIASKIEAESIEINLRRRDDCFAAVRRLPFVSTNEHLLLARDLIASGITTDPDEITRVMEKKKPLNLKKSPKKKLKKKKKRDNFFF